MNMKPHLICLTAALAAALSACGGTPVQESAPAAESAAVSAAPVPTPTAAVKPTASPAPAPTPAETAVVTAAPTVEPTEEPGPTPAPTPTAAVTAAPTPTPAAAATAEPTPPPAETEPTPEPPARPSDEEVLAAYREAEEAYRWFDLTTLPLDYENAAGEPTEAGQYYRVADERFATMDALRGYLKGLFSDEIVDRLLPLDGVRYVEIDGALCAVEAGRGTDGNSGAVTAQVFWPEGGDDNWCTVQVAVELLREDPEFPEGTRVYQFPYQKVGEKWVFTYFEAIM